MSRSDKSANDRAPLCPVCNHRHWTREPHDFRKVKPAKEKRRGR